MENLIPVINKLQDVFNTVGFEAIQLPQIVVIGTQSSGKSSVLEKIVGKSFLPRGTGIVTRRPLILQLLHTQLIEETEESGEAPWGYGMFLHRGQHKYYDFAEICAEIQNDTDKVSGTNKGISNDSILLKVYSPQVLNLTLCDLPGITRVPVGDQSEDIETQTKELVLKFITPPNSIILVVHAANTDLATSEALKLAQQVDPDGRRTLMVCTKIDLMDAGTSAVELLTGKIIPVRLGIVGVVNRSQQDINTNKSIEESLKSEIDYFRRYYPGLSPKSGTVYLSHKLNSLLMNHIRDCLPELKSRVADLTYDYENQMLDLGDEIREKGPLLLHIIHRFTSAYIEEIDGRSKDIEVVKLCGGARICYIFHETLSKNLKLIVPLENISHQEIITAMRNSTGTSGSLFVPEIAFELLVKRQIKRLKEPSLKCVQLVFEELQKILLKCIKSVSALERYSLLEERILDISYEMFRKRLPITNEMVGNLIKIELAYINTNHPDFKTTQLITQANYSTNFNGSTNMGASTNPISRRVPAANTTLHEPDIPVTSSTASKGGIFGLWTNPTSSQQTINSLATDQPTSGYKEDSSTDNIESPKGSQLVRDTAIIHTTDKQERDCIVIEQLISSYFDIVRKNVLDSIPKAVMYFLVNFVKDNLQNELVANLYLKEEHEGLLQEAEHVSERRQEVESVLEALRKASQIINQLRDPDFQHRKY